MKTDRFSKRITVKEMADYLNNAVESGCGDYAIHCVDGTLHEDDIGINMLDKTVLLRGNLFHENKVRKVTQLESDIKNAIEKFMME